MADTRIETPTFYKVILDAIEQRLAEVYTSMPAAIVSYDRKKNLAVVQPGLKRKYASKDQPVKLPLVANVTIAHPRMGDAHLRLPVKKGDTGHLVFSMRSLETWMARGEPVDPEDPRKFALQDAVFYPGLHPQTSVIKSQSSTTATSLELKNAMAFLEMTTTGKFRFGNGQVELVSLLYDLLTELIAAVILTPVGPGSFAAVTVAKLQALQVKLGQLKKG